MYENKWIYYNERKKLENRIRLQLSKVQGEVSPRPAFSPCTTRMIPAARGTNISQYANAKESGAQ